MKTAAEFAEYLYRHVPLSRAMGVQVELYDGGSLHLSAPLAANHNDKGSAFAGSIGGLASLAGWGLMMLSSDPWGPCHSAIASADIHYTRPLLGDFTAVATLPDAEALARFRQVFAERGRGKLPVRIEIRDAHGVGAVQQAVYAVWKLPVTADNPTGQPV